MDSKNEKKIDAALEIRVVAGCVLTRESLTMALENIKNKCIDPALSVTEKYRWMELGRETIALVYRNPDRIRTEFDKFLREVEGDKVYAMHRIAYSGSRT